MKHAVTTGFYSVTPPLNSAYYAYMNNYRKFVG